MIFIIIAVVAFIAAQVIAKGDYQYRPFAKTLKVISVVVLLIGIISACVVQIDAGYTGVKKLFGKVQNEVLSSGLHFVNPLIEVMEMDIKTQNYTMSGLHDESIGAADDAIRVFRIHHSPIWP